MAPPRIVATDLDGTLLRSDGTASPRTRAALARARAAGAQVLVVTGRPPRYLADVAEEAGLEGLVACANGALLYDLGSGAIVEHAPLDAPVAAAIAAELRAAAPGVLFAIEREHVFGHEPAYPLRFEPPPGTVSDDVGVLVGDGVTKLIARHDALAHDELVALVARIAGERATVTHGGSVIVEISARGIDKARGLRLLCEASGIDPADAAAFGDMPNDLPMLALAGRAIAVANAHPLVLAAADEVAPSNDEDGVAVVVERWFRA